VGVTTDGDIDLAIAIANRRKVVDTSIYGLYFRDQAESAFTVFTLPQYLLFGTALIALMLGLWAAPLTTLFALNVPITLFFVTVVAFRTVVGVSGAAAETTVTITDDEVQALRDRDLPSYSILVPAYREAAVIGRLLTSLKALDYPADKLDILLLLEEDDADTLAAAKAASPGANVRLLVVPSGQPQTKPKACNVGLLFAQGEYLVIYDAEDQPEPDQLKKAVLAFRRGPKELICLQAALNYYNWNENFLTRMFTLEYSFWFDYLLPGLDKLRMPIPLGGTSNHFKTPVLRELGGWDPFNVTEDADLGIRRDARLSCRHRQFDDVRRSEQAPRQLAPAALALDQGLHADRAGLFARPDRPGAPRRAAAGAGLRAADWRHAADLSLPADLDPVDAGVGGDADHRARSALSAGDPLSLALQPAAGQRAGDLHQHVRRLQAPAPSPGALCAAESALLDAALDRLVQGTRPALHPPLLLGEDHPWSHQTPRQQPLSRARPGGSGRCWPCWPRPRRRLRRGC
jgi:hypothetical protein